jgi:hypothetical protein
MLAMVLQLKSIGYGKVVQPLSSELRGVVAL